MLEIKDVLKSLFQTKEDLTTVVDENALLVERGLIDAPEMWVIKRIISLSPEYCNEVNEINIWGKLDETMQYDFLRHRLPKLKRAPYNPYIKPEKPTDDVKLVMEYYQYSEQKAREALELFTPEQVQIIRDQYFEGGIAEKKKKKKAD